jgi:MoaA/NifB/PqqE/SkfB family radical SAM enzyme
MTKQVINREYFGLGEIPRGIGAVLHGWHGGVSSVFDFRAMTGACKHDCFHCFTDKRRKTLTLEQIEGVIDQASELGFKGIDYLGEGEPTLDKDFFRIIEHTSKKGIVPVVFTDGATKLTDKEFVRRIYDSGASVCPKCDSLFNPEYQNWVVGDKAGKYFDERNHAIAELINHGFNATRDDGRTRLGFDMVVTKRNVDEIEQTLKYCRDNNLWVVFSTYLPAGRSGSEDFNRSLVLSQEELTKMRETVKRVDGQYGFNHPVYNNFATFPCVEFMQVYGDGRVSPCPGNETVVGNIRTDSLRNLRARILEQFPCHDPSKFDGHCLYRPKIE